MSKILYITHTNPNNDSRVLKVLEAGLHGGNICLSLGIQRGQKVPDSEYSYSVTSVSKIFLNFYFKKKKRFVIINLFLNIIIWSEIFLKILIRGWKFKPEIIHCHDWFMLPAAALLKIVCRTKLIYDAHELESECQGMPRSLKFLARTTESKLWSRVDVFITVSKSIETWYLNKYGNKKSLIVFNSPQILSESFEVGNQDIYNLRKIFSISARSKIYLYSGRLTAGRGIDIILKSFLSVNSDAVLVFLGEGPLIADIKDLSEKHSNIFYHPSVAHNIVVEVARSADFGLCLIEDASLSDYYCLPNKLFEYAFANLPIIASNLPEIKNLVTEYSLGQCISNNEKELTRMIEVNDLQQSELKKPLNKSLFEFSWEKQEQTLIKLYTSILIKDF
jgi:glycosyltransferase involved in cell wall biosynthesis